MIFIVIDNTQFNICIFYYIFFINFHVSNEFLLFNLYNLWGFLIYDDDVSIAFFWVIIFIYYY